MYKFAVLLVIFIVSIENSECSAFGRTAGRLTGASSSYVGKRNSYLIGNSGETVTTTDKINYSEDLSQKGLSAWGLILIMIAVIVLAFSAYYGIICYPFLCKTEKNYQFVDVSSTMTGATSSSIQSMENFQIDARDSKH